MWVADPCNLNRQSLIRKTTSYGAPLSGFKLLLIQVWATWKGRWTEEEKSLFSYTKELELLELAKKAYLLMFLERKGGTVDSKRKEDKALTLPSRDED